MGIDFFSLQRPRIALALVAVGLCLQGCGRSNSVYNDEPPPKQTQVTADGLTILPSGFYNQSVNKARVDLTEKNGKTYLRFQTLPDSSANTAGSFNDPAAIGNLSLLGVSLFEDAVLATDFPLFSFEAKQAVGTRPLDLYLQVDLDCNGSLPYVLRATSSDMTASAVAGGFTKFTVASSDLAWTSNGTDIVDGSSNVLIPESDSGNGLGSLDDLVAEYPNACIRNDQTNDPNFPYSLPTGGVLIGLGDGNETQGLEIWVREVTLGTKTFSDWEP